MGIPINPGGRDAATIAEQHFASLQSLATRTLEKAAPSLALGLRLVRCANEYPVVRQNSVGTLNPVLVTMLQAAQHAVRFKRILNFGEGQVR